MEIKILRSVPNFRRVVLHRYNIKRSKPTIAAMTTRVSASMMAAYAGFPRDEAMMLLSK